MKWFEFIPLTIGICAWAYSFVKISSFYYVTAKKFERNQSQIKDMMEVLRCEIDTLANNVNSTDRRISGVLDHKDYFDIALYHLLASARLQHLVVQRDSEKNGSYEAAASAKKFVKNIDKLLKYRRENLKG